MRLTALPFFFFFFNDTATTEIYTLSLHDALPISLPGLKPVFEVGIGTVRPRFVVFELMKRLPEGELGFDEDRKSTRLNSSHLVISYAVFCLKKKKKTKARAFPVNDK